MKLGITQKLLLAFIVTNGVVVILMMVFIRWNFGHGFRDYIRQTELRRLDALAEPYTEVAEFADLETPPLPEEIVHQTFCGT